MSAPMVSATLGMIKQIGFSTGSSYSARELRDLVSYTANLTRSICSPMGTQICSVSGPETYFLGRKIIPTLLIPINMLV